MLLALLVVSMVAACSSDVAVSRVVERPDINVCQSHYQEVAVAPTRQALRSALLDVDPRVLRLRSRGISRSASSSARQVRWVDLLGSRGRRIMQVEVFERPDRQWYAGIWYSCY